MSLGQELEALAAQGELRPFMRLVGKRMAAQMPLPKVDALKDLEAAMNRHWDRISWGWVSLEEEPASLVIRHSAAPLYSAFGRGSLAWSPALLEGIYEHWFAVAGADENLSVSQYQPTRYDDDAMTFQFHLAPASANGAFQDKQSTDG